MRKFIDWCIFLVGLFFLGTILHECLHYLVCGGTKMIAGLYIDLKETHVGATWCTKTFEGWRSEFWPYLAEWSFDILGIYLKAKK